jgi:hypothetical protein
LYSLGATSTANLSFFIAADFYLDFGLVLLPILSYILGYFIKLILKSGRNEQLSLTEMFMISSAPILIRGPVGAILGLPACLIFGSFALSYFLKKKWKS